MNVSKSMPGMDCLPSKQEPQKAIQLNMLSCVSTLSFGLAPARSLWHDESLYDIISYTRDISHQAFARPQLEINNTKGLI